jgi:hypothetical protein
MRRRKQLGELASVKPSRVTLDEFAREWWQRYASTELARTTQERHAAVWDLHVLPRLGGVQMGQLNPGVIDAFQAELRKAGVGEPTIRKTLALLQAVCRVARERVRPWCDLRPIVARTKNETRGLRGFRKSPLTDSNRRPPPYHRGSGAGRAGKTGKPRARKPRKKRESAEEE